jgi:hypothetical protein
VVEPVGAGPLGRFRDAKTCKSSVSGSGVATAIPLDRHRDGVAVLQRLGDADSATSIEDYAFTFCSSLTAIFFQGNAPSADATAFWRGTNATVYYLQETTGWGSTFAGLPAVLWNPSIQTTDASFGVRSNQLGFTIIGTINIPIVVEACTNLAGASWRPLQTSTLANSSIYFSDSFSIWATASKGIGFRCAYSSDRRRRPRRFTNETVVIRLGPS